MSDFVEEFVFEKYKDEPLGLAKKFRTMLRRTYKIKNDRDVYVRLSNYQCSKYGQRLVEKNGKREKKENKKMRNRDEEEMICEMLLYSIINKKDIKVGDVYKIAYCFNGNLSKHTNNILIINTNESIKAVWYDGDYMGMPYLILPYQIFLEKLEENINLDKYFEDIKYKSYLTRDCGERFGDLYEII